MQKQESRCSTLNTDSLLRHRCRSHSTVTALATALGFHLRFHDYDVTSRKALQGSGLTADRERVKKYKS